MGLIWYTVLTCTKVTISTCELYGLPLHPCGDFVFAGSMIMALVRLKETLQ